MMELKNSLDKVIDRGDGWLDPEQGYVITSLLDDQDHVYEMDESTEFSIIEFTSHEMSQLINWYDVVKNDSDFSEDDLLYIHYDNTLNPWTIWEIKVLRALGYTEEHKFGEIDNLKEFVSKFIDFVNAKHKETADKINSLISEETDQTIIDEYKLVTSDLETSVKDFISSLEEKIKLPEEIVDHWPTLLNPSPFMVFRNSLTVG